MRVALLSDCYLPRLGGIEVQTHDLAGQLVRAGHQVEVFTATTGNHGERFGAAEEVDGIRVHRFALPLPGGVPVNPFAPPEIRRRLLTGGFDVGHVQMGVVSPFATDMVRIALGIELPTAVTWHCVLDGSRPLWRALGGIRRWAERGAALSAVSAMAAERVATVAGVAPVHVLSNGIDAARWAPATPRMPRTDGVVKVTTAQRLVRRKRPGVLVDVLAEAVDRLPAGARLEVDVFGAGPQRGAIQRSLKGRGMAEWVRLRGRVSREELRAAHQDADLYLSAARLESFGIAALEARTAGLPVIARAGTGADDFVTDGVNGLLASDDTGLAAAVARLAGDPGLRGRIAEHNATVPPSQDWPSVVSATLAEYQRAVAGPRVLR